MSQNTSQTVKCPKCEAMHPVTVWTTIDAKQDPDLKQDILSRKINIFSCPDCGQMALMPSPLFYKDEDKKLILYFSPATTHQDRQRLFEDLKQKSSAEIKQMQGYHLRFISEYNELLEKILIFDAGLDDKVVEFLKMMILMQTPDKAENRVAMFGKLENGYIEFMLHDKKENQVYTSNIPMSTYDMIKDQLAQSGVKYESFDWEMVDLDYSSKLLTGMNN